MLFTVRISCGLYVQSSTLMHTVKLASIIRTYVFHSTSHRFTIGTPSNLSTSLFQHLNKHSFAPPAPPAACSPCPSVLISSDTHSHHAVHEHSNAQTESHTGISSYDPQNQRPLQCLRWLGIKTRSPRGREAYWRDSRGRRLVGCIRGTACG